MPLTPYNRIEKTIFLLFKNNNDINQIPNNQLMYKFYNITKEECNIFTKFNLSSNPHTKSICKKFDLLLKSVQQIKVNCRDDKAE